MSSTKTKFCKVCKDCGKTEEEYTSHNVRHGGKVVCPTLKELRCRYCKEKGHTPKHCPKLAERKVRVGGKPENGNTRMGVISQPKRLVSGEMPVPGQSVSSDGWHQVKRHGNAVKHITKPQVQPPLLEGKSRFMALDVEEQEDEETNGQTTFPQLKSVGLGPGPKNWGDYDSDGDE